MDFFGLNVLPKSVDFNRVLDFWTNLLNYFGIIKIKKYIKYK